MGNGLQTRQEALGAHVSLSFVGSITRRIVRRTSRLTACRIYSFANLLEDADTAPNQQETQTYADMHNRLEAQLAAWNKLKQSDLAAFQAKLPKEAPK